MRTITACFYTVCVSACELFAVFFLAAAATAAAVAAGGVGRAVDRQTWNVLFGAILQKGHKHKHTRKVDVDLIYMVFVLWK